MPLKLPSATSVALGATVPACLAYGLTSDQWALGAAGAATGLCLLALQKPLRRFRGHPSSTSSTPSKVVAADPRASREKWERLAAELGDDETSQLVLGMLTQGRYTILLRPQIASSLSARHIEIAQSALDEAMSVVPQGPVMMRSRRFDELADDEQHRGQKLVHVDGFFLDRYPVTNAEYQQFVSDGGYEQMSLWDESIWPAVLGFVDKTNQPGPRFWSGGHYELGKQDHPVVGISWYEASAYARWAGKRLPSDPEWVKAGSWPVLTDAKVPVQRRYPWGEALDRRLANLWGSGPDATVPVHSHPEGASVGGVQQLIGNVWEWTSSQFGAFEPVGQKIETGSPLRSIRGGAFDTYFDSQSHCQFQSGEGPLARKHNIGFRCALGFVDVVTTGASDSGASSELSIESPEEQNV